MNIILVEDDMPLCKTLVHIVRLYAPSVNLVACCHTVQEAQSALMHHKPDLVLADVRLPDGTGFDALMEVQQALNCHTLPFPVAFMTADTQSQNALDYLQTMLFFKPMGFCENRLATRR